MEKSETIKYQIKKLKELSKYIDDIVSQLESDLATINKSNNKYKKTNIKFRMMKINTIPIKRKSTKSFLIRNHWNKKHNWKVM